MEQSHTQTPSSKTPYHLRIEPEKGTISLRLGELFEYRELLFFYTLRDVSIRYKQTVLGILWAILQPFMTMVVFSLFFGRLAQLSSDGLPYPIFNYAALVPWTFFATSLAQSSNSLVQNANLLKKIYFPRLVFPISTILSSLVDMFLSFLILVGMMFYFQIPLNWNMLWLPLFVLLTLCTALGVGLWLSAMNVQFRDIRYTVPFLTQIWMFSTPIVYSSSLIQDPLLRVLYGLNPMVGVVEGFRWALLGTDTRPDLTIIASTAMSLIILVTGLIYFRRMEKSFADLV